MSAYKVDLSAAQNGASLNLSGRRIEITGASSPAAVATLVAVYADGYTRSPYTFKEQYKASSQVPFADLKITNAAQPGEWLEIEVTQSDSEWIYDPRDDIFIDSIATPIEIDSTTPIKVDDDATQTKLDALNTSVAATTTMLQNDRLQRNALTTLAGVSFAEKAAASDTTVVSGAANVAGVIIRRATVICAATNSSAYVKVNGNNLLYGVGSASGASQLWIENVFVPAGQAILIGQTVNTIPAVQLWYEVL